MSTAGSHNHVSLGLLAVHIAIKDIDGPCVGPFHPISASLLTQSSHARMHTHTHRQSINQATDQISVFVLTKSSTGQREREIAKKKESKVIVLVELFVMISKTLLTEMFNCCLAWFIIQLLFCLERPARFCTPQITMSPSSVSPSPASCIYFSSSSATLVSLPVFRKIVRTTRYNSVLQDLQLDIIPHFHQSEPI